jgi:hypothetical protein
LHAFLNGGRQSRLLSFMSMMAGKKVGKETFVPIYDVSHKNKFYGSNQAELKKSSCKATAA